MSTLVKEAGERESSWLPALPVRTFVGRLGGGREGDVVELAQAQPFPVHGHTEVAEINGLPGSLRDLVRGGGWGIGLRRQVGHDDDSADITTTTTTKETT